MDRSSDGVWSVFGMFMEPVLAVKDGEIIYANTAARDLLGREVLSADPRTILPEYMLGEEACGRVGTVTVSGRELCVSAALLDGAVVYSFSGADSPCFSPSERAARELNEKLSLIRMAAEHLTELMDGDALNFAAIINHACYSLMKLSGNVELLGCGLPGGDRQVFELSRLCRLLMDTLAAMTEKRGLRLRLSSSPEEILICADRRQIQRLILNLLSNAVKFTPSGGCIDLNLRETGGRLELSVSDTGRGIPPERLGKVWDRYKDSMDLREPEAGVGLGLTAVRRIAESYGGGAVMESVPGRGTTVTVYLDVIPTESEMEAYVRLNDTVRIYGENEDWPTEAERRMLMTELSDALDSAMYHHRYLE